MSREGVSNDNCKGGCLEKRLSLEREGGNANS